ncbi:xylosyltransferase oxt [Venturia canescens]|uniref:xylosyltransferase oxt n=1 Tax=Venturia canescens TaxID=32260 RepID=UPI001C9C9251|nr:xylosyltransferase oxt [Venturia canescens]
MATMRGQLDVRSSSCLRKYRIFFIIVITILSVQVYLAYVFLTLENVSSRAGRSSSGEGGSSQPEEGEGLPKASRQLKLPPDKKSNDKTLPNHGNRTARLKLDKKSLNFTPICDVTGREAVSAVTRARTQVCKQRIVNVTCLGQSSLLFSSRLYSSCPHSPGFDEVPESLGCFKDDKTLRILSGYYAIYKGNNSPKQCAFMCLQSGYPYAGVEYSVECFCGMEEPPRVKRLPDSSCNMKCPGESKLSCGGYLTINVFWTGIQRFRAQEARNSSVKMFKEQQPVKIAFLLTVNGRASRQVKRLINVLYHPSHLYYIHVDARQDYLYREMLDVEKTCRANNIKVAKGIGRRHASIWGGASLLTTLLSSAQEMLKHPHHWDFLVNLSESDFPIKRNDQLTDFLTWNRGLNFVKSHGREVQRFITKQGLDKSFVECEARMWRVGDRKLPKGIQIDGGSDWVALSRDFVEYVAKPNPDALVAGLVEIFKYTLLPAESFFHTVLRNSRFCDTYVDNNLHVTNWKRKLGCKCQYKAVVDWCGCSPNDFKLEDFARIRNTAERNLFFARKFEPSIDQRIIDKVEEWLYPERANHSKSSKGYDAYWQNLYHHGDLSPPADDTLLTISNSLARLLFSSLKIDPRSAKLLETTAYFRENKFQGILITTESSGNKNQESSTLQNDHYETLETLVKLRNNFSIFGVWIRRIKTLSIGTDYDQKEQIFRNLLGGIGPLADPILAYEFDASLVTPRNISVLWIDPVGRLADVSHLQIEESTLTGSAKPQLSEPLIIGTWRVLLFADTVLVAKIKFLVTPLSYWKNRRMTARKAKELHNGPTGAYNAPEELNKKWTSVLKNLSRDEISETNKKVEEQTGVELDRWIDTLVYDYYEITEICSASGIFTGRTSKLKKCIQTDWSSMSPDPKADIRNLCQNY